jgi:hypothetical protein
MAVPFLPNGLFPAQLNKERIATAFEWRAKRIRGLAAQSSIVKSRIYSL